MWDGIPPEDQQYAIGEHNPGRDRAWCHTCKEWCYRNLLCQCCLVGSGYRMLWLSPDGRLYEDDGATPFEVQL